MRKLMFLFLLLFLMMMVSAQFSNPTTGFSNYRIYGASSNPQFNDPNFYSVGGFTDPRIYWPQFDRNDCSERHDIILQIAPGGCSPSVVRSDLLEEQNVPVFCKVSGLQVNPLIDVSQIRSLRFSGDLPKGVSGVSYFPARAALRSQDRLISSPIEDNMGYLVVVLSRQEVEGELPDSIEGTITATIDYDIEEAFGIGRTNFYISELSDEDWRRDYQEYSFWNGKGCVRADSVEGDRATISIYSDVDSRQTRLTLTKGQTSEEVFLGGFYCSAGLNIRIDEIGAPVESALLRVSRDSVTQQMWVAVGDRILDDRCRITDLDAYDGGGKLGVSCPVENGRFDLRLNPGRASFDGNSRAIGEQVDSAEGVFLAYVGKDVEGVGFTVLIKDEYSLSQEGFMDKGLYDVIDRVVRGSSKGIDELGDDIENRIVNRYREVLRNVDRDVIRDRVIIEIVIEGEKSDSNLLLNEVEVAQDKDYSDASGEDLFALGYYDQAVDYYKDLADLYPNDRRISAEDSYAAQGLWEAAQLAKLFELDEQTQDFYDRLIEEQANSDLALTVQREKDLLVRYDTSDSKAAVLVNNQQYFIDLLDFRKPTRDEASVDVVVNGVEMEIGLGDLFPQDRDTL